MSKKPVDKKTAGQLLKEAVTASLKKGEWTPPPSLENQSKANQTIPADSAGRLETIERELQQIELKLQQKELELQQKELESQNKRDELFLSGLVKQGKLPPKHAKECAIFLTEVRLHGIIEFGEEDTHKTIAQFKDVLSNLPVILSFGINTR